MFPRATKPSPACVVPSTQLAAPFREARERPGRSLPLPGLRPHGSQPRGSHPGGSRPWGLHPVPGSAPALESASHRLSSGRWDRQFQFPLTVGVAHRTTDGRSANPSVRNCSRPSGTRSGRPAAARRRRGEHHGGSEARPTPSARQAMTEDPSSLIEAPRRPRQIPQGRRYRIPTGARSRHEGKRRLPDATFSTTTASGRTSSTIRAARARADFSPADRPRPAAKANRYRDPADDDSPAGAELPVVFAMRPSDIVRPHRVGPAVLEDRPAPRVKLHLGDRAGDGPDLSRPSPSATPGKSGYPLMPEPIPRSAVPAPLIFDLRLCRIARVRSARRCMRLRSCRL